MIKKNGDGRWVFDVTETIKVLILVGGLLAGYFTAMARMEKVQAITDEKVANLQTNYNMNTIDKKEEYRQLLLEIKEVRKEINEIKVQIGRP